jgi:hypothetical protein
MEGHGRGTEAQKTATATANFRKNCTARLFVPLMPLISINAVEKE